MLVKSKSVKFLSGTPNAQALSWDEGILLSTFCPQIRRYLGESSAEPSENQETASLPFPAWRLISVKEDQRGGAGPGSSSQDIDSAFASDEPSVNRDQMDFLEHSYATMQDIHSSQLQAVDGALADTTLDLTSLTNTFSTTSTSFVTSEDSTFLPSGEPLAGLLNFSGVITDLDRIPSAFSLQRLQPQTVTVNLITGVIALSSPRTVSLRRRPDIEMEIIELLVGDDTRAGFNVSFWLSSCAAGNKANATGTGAVDAYRESVAERQKLGSLRPGEIVLLTNVALGGYRGCVYGQSLNRKTTRNRTSVTVVTESARVPELITRKVDRVKEWADRFVGAGGRAKRDATEEEPWNGPSKRSCTRKEEVLPPDTQ